MLLLPVDVFLSAAVLSSDDLSEDLSDAVFALSELPAAGAELSLYLIAYRYFAYYLYQLHLFPSMHPFHKLKRLAFCYNILCIFSHTDRPGILFLPLFS